MQSNHTEANTSESGRACHSSSLGSTLSVSLDMTRRHPLRIQPNDLVLQIVEHRLPLTDKLRLELAPAVPRHLYFQLPAVRSYRLFRIPVPRIPGFRTL